MGAALMNSDPHVGCAAQEIGQLRLGDHTRWRCVCVACLGVRRPADLKEAPATESARLRVERRAGSRTRGLAINKALAVYRVCGYRLRSVRDYQFGVV